MQKSTEAQSTSWRGANLRRKGQMQRAVHPRCPITRSRLSFSRLPLATEITYTHESRATAQEARTLTMTQLRGTVAKASRLATKWVWSRVEPSSLRNAATSL